MSALNVYTGVNTETAMKMGVREFRERISEVVNGDEVVVVTNGGRVVGRYLPNRQPRDVEAVRRAAASIKNWQDEMRAKGVDLEAVLADIGLDPWGEPLDQLADH